MNLENIYMVADDFYEDQWMINSCTTLKLRPIFFIAIKFNKHKVQLWKNKDKIKLYLKTLCTNTTKRAWEFGGKY